MYGISVHISVLEALQKQMEPSQLKTYNLTKSELMSIFQRHLEKRDHVFGVVTIAAAPHASKYL